MYENMYENMCYEIMYYEIEIMRSHQVALVSQAYLGSSVYKCHLAPGLFSFWPGQLDPEGDD